MSKRNFILLIIVLGIVLAIIFGFFYFYQSGNQTGGTTQGTNFLANFLPFGKSKTTTTNTVSPTDVSGYVPNSDNQINNNLKKISSFPIAGYGIFMKERLINTATPTDQTNPTNPVSPSSTIKTPTPLTEFAPALRYVNKSTGNIYETFADNIDERQFSSTVIPKVYEAVFGNNAQSVIMRYLKDDNKTIETFVGTLPKELLGANISTINSITGSFLPENISDMSVSPDTSKVFYLFDTGDNSIGVTYDLTTNTKIQVFDSPFTEWLSSWPNNNMITITTKPASQFSGFVYAINPIKKDLNKILSGINGMTTLTSPNGKMILYNDNNLSLSIFNTDTGNSNSLGLNTLPEKCIWGSASDIIYCAVPKYIDSSQNYPDAWYQGIVSFSDEIWEINVTSGNTIKILDPASISGEDIDAIKLGLDQNQNYLFFMNKKNSYLWEFLLK